MIICFGTVTKVRKEENKIEKLKRFLKKKCEILFPTFGFALLKREKCQKQDHNFVEQWFETYCKVRNYTVRIRGRQSSKLFLNLLVTKFWSDKDKKCAICTVIYNLVTEKNLNMISNKVKFENK